MRANRNNRYDWEAMKNVKKCDRCGCDVMWQQNKSGKWYLVDVTMRKGTDGHLDVFQSGIYHTCRGSIDEQISTKRNAIAQITKELAAVDPADWFDPTDELKRQLAENERQLAELIARMEGKV